MASSPTRRARTTSYPGSTISKASGGCASTRVRKVGGVPYRRSPRSTPVTLVKEDGQRWLVAPYGPVGWVHNARATGHVRLSRGRRSETVRVKELAAEAAAPILKAYLERVPITRPYFDVTPDAPLAAFAAEASKHPVFQVVP